ncbi:hypothetical protein [Massiliimalia timonensis]|uniref:hypothetical protein n=1 Tax=Massiliimalia timonensis TaxID=1987501 RepID=UPI00189D5B44|nr:hypothetical protein [Massiliimalia timonensis]
MCWTCVCFICFADSFISGIRTDAKFGGIRRPCFREFFYLKFYRRGINTGKTSEASNSKNNPFSGDCGIAASGKIGTNIIGYPTLTIDIENISDKDISAIQFYVVPYDVYGEEITTLWTFSQHHLYTDDTIAAGHSDELYYDPFIEDSIKTMKLYVYSVYFADGTEWGDKDASESTILKKGIPIEVSGES